MNTLATTANYGYLRSPSFDIAFILLIPAIAILAGFFSHLDVQYFELILTLDLWLLGYHHVISTYTRLAFDRDAFDNQKFLIFYLPIIVALSVGGIAWTIGLTAIATIYLHWQWYHYTRQSEGISKAYSIKSGSDASKQSTFDRIMFYLVPAVCFLDMSSNGNQNFLGMKIWVIPVNSTFIEWTLLATAAVFSYWLITKTRLLAQRKISVSYYTYLLSHYTIYFVAYAYIENINYGWIVINIWHNAQYIAFVWFYNTNKYGKVENKKNPLLFLARPKNIVLYLSACLAISSVVYVGINALLTGLPVFMLILVYQTLNFHHYIVDSQIWKLRKKPMQETLSINS